MNTETDTLKLENQLCFSLYACAKEVVRMYKPHLDQLDLTYTQFITMMVLWEKKELNVKELGSYLYLDSGTLTPLLKKLEKKGYVIRKRDERDERNLVITITEEGALLKEKSKYIPDEISKCLLLSEDDSKSLFRILNQLLSTF